MALYYVIIDEHGRQIDNVSYLDKEFAKTVAARLNDEDTENKFYRVRSGITGWNSR